MLSSKIRSLLLALFMLAAAAAVSALESELIDFEIKDQFDHEHRDEDFRGAVTVLIGSDKDGSEYNRLWSKAILDAIAPGADEPPYKSLPVAHLKGVPFFLKGFIKGKFPKDEDNWVLMDWKGKFAKAYAFAPGECNVIVFDASGARALRVHGKEPAGEKLDRVVNTLREFLAEPAP